jgi:hypothetical protein
VAGVEWGARRAFRRRSSAWLAAYAALGAAAAAAGARINPGSLGDDRGRTIAGAVLAMAGYPVGRAVFSDRPDAAPPEPAPREAVAIAGVVAPAEELVWGQMVEPALGIAPTAALFALKHPLVDGRWRRAFGLGLTWCGLGLVRKASPAAALAIHVGCNASGVVMGRITGKDQF